MSGRVPGVIALSYARSAGTGDQQVPGMVTSRRSTNKQERYKKKQQMEEEEQKAKKRQEEMQAAAKLLAQKWAQEDKKKGAQQAAARLLAQKWAQEDKTKSKKKGRSRSRSRRRRRDDTAQEEDDEDEGDDDAGDDSDEEEEEEGGWVQIDSKADSSSNKQEIPRSSPSRSAQADSRGAQKAVSSRGGWASIEEPEREASRPIGGVGSTAGPLAAKGPTTTTAARKERLARVFAFGDDEDDEDTKRREAELAEKAKKSKMSLEAHAPPATLSGIRTPLPGDGGSAGSVEMSNVLMKMAEWKRKCGGKRVPMPEEMKAQVARAMGAQP